MPSFTKLTGVNTTPLRRLVCNIEGGEKSGKTDWFLRTAPEPVYYFCFDPNGMEIAKKIARLGRNISAVNFGVPDRDQKPDFHKRQWAEFRRLLTEALAGRTGSICVDSFTEVYDYVRLAKYGKTEQIVARNYGTIYDELNDILNEAYEAETVNFAIIHKLKPEFVNDKSTGGMILDGWKNAPYAVQANFQLLFDPSMPAATLAGKFRIEVKNNNMNMNLNGWQSPPEMGSIPYTADWFTFETMLQMTFAE
jgi:hypothetical protein